MTAEAQAQAKQLDSVTDVVQDTTEFVDASKVQQAMASAGGTAAASNSTASSKVSSYRVSKDHVKFILNEFDGYMTEDQAEKALRDAYDALNEDNKTSDNDDYVLKAALRKLISST